MNNRDVCCAIFEFVVSVEKLSGLLLTAQAREKFKEFVNTLCSISSNEVSHWGTSDILSFASLCGVGGCVLVVGCDDCVCVCVCANSKTTSCWC